MKPEMRQKLARQPFAEKIRKVAQLIRLAKTFPRHSRPPASTRAAVKSRQPLRLRHHQQTAGDGRQAER